MKTQIVKIKIHEESDLYSPFDPDQKLLSEDVISYFTGNYMNVQRNNREKYQIHIISDTPVNEENVKNSIFEYCSREKDNIDFELKKMTSKTILLLSMGVIILAVWLLISARTENVSTEILSILGWITIWEGADIAILDRPELRHLQKAYEQALKAEVIIDAPEGDTAPCQ